MLIVNPECPHCHSQVINRHGKSGAMQRYRCKNCLKTFPDYKSTSATDRNHHNNGKNAEIMHPLVTDLTP